MITRCLFELLIDLVGGLVRGILDFVLGVLGSIVYFLTKLTGRVAGGATAILDPDVVVQRCGISKPGNIRDRQVTGALVNLKEIVSNSKRRDLVIHKEIRE